MQRNIYAIRILFLVICTVLPLKAYTQTRTLVGIVTDKETNEPLPGVSVVIKGSTTGVLSDVTGNYSINVKEDPETVIQFSFVGYKKQEITIEDKTRIDVLMEIESKTLDEVVVIGYGIQKKSLVTGAIAKVKSEEITSQPAQRIEQALQGKTSGVVFNQESGNPGAGFTVRIRGVGSNQSSDPLFIIDGFKSSKNVMNGIDPSDIESVEVLKDAASAAIYGSEGANGVIIITTKSGSGKKDKTTINYDFYYGIQEVVNPVKVMDAKQYTKYMSEGWAYDRMKDDHFKFKNYLNSPIATTLNLYNDEAGKLALLYRPNDVIYNDLNQKIDEGYNQGIINLSTYNTEKGKLAKMKPKTFEEWQAEALTDTAKSPFARIDQNSAGTNWLNEIFKAAPVVKHHISLQGGNELTNYYLGLSYYSQDGIVGKEKNNFTRYNASINVDHKAKEWLKLGTNSTLAQTESHVLPVNDIYQGIVACAMTFDPTLNPYWNNASEIPLMYRSYTDSLLQNEDGKYYTISPTVSGELTNPLFKIRTNENHITTVDWVLSNLYAELYIFKDLTFRSNAGINASFTTDDNWLRRYYYNEVNFNPYNSVSKKIERDFRYQIENVATYNKTIGNSAFTLMAGNSYEKQIIYDVNAERSNLLEESWNNAILDAAENNKSLNNNSGNRVIYSMLSYFGRLNYNYKEKYLLTGTYRRDGSSRFHPSNRFGNFSSLSAGWVISREEFFKMQAVSFLKVRSSWGQNGSISNVDPYQYLVTLGRGDGDGYNGEQGLITGTIVNKDLTWETSEQTDIGADFGFFRNKLTFSADWYSKTTKNLIFKPFITRLMGERAADFNAASVVNTGWEFDLGINNKDNVFKYDFKFTATYLENEVTDLKALYLGYQTHGGTPHTVFAKGNEIWYFQGFKVKGIFQNWDQIRNYSYTDPATGLPKPIQPDAMPGDPIIEDVSGAKDSNGKNIPDGNITDDDMQKLGKPLPTWNFGLSASFDFKGFDFSLYFYSEVDKTIFNSLSRDDRLEYNRPAKFYNQRWTGENSTNGFMRAVYNNTADKTILGHNSYFFEDGSFLRLKSIQLGYTIPQKISRFIKIEKLRIYASASNLLTITNYTGSDPEIGITNNGAANSYGIDRGMYPTPRQLIGGINVTF